MNNTNFPEFFKKLPLDLREAMSSIDTSTAVERIAGKHRLLIDKMGILAEEIGNVMFGVSHPKDFIHNLSDKLGVDRETARKIAEDVNQQIFSKVRESLRNLHGIADEEKTMKGIPGEIKKLQPLEIKPAPPVSWPTPSQSESALALPWKDAPSPSSFGLAKPKPPQEISAATPSTQQKVDMMKPTPMPLPASFQQTETTREDAAQEKKPLIAPPANLPVAHSLPPNAPKKETSPNAEAGQEQAGPAFAGPAFQDKIEEKVSVQAPELRKIERPTATDPYREPIE